MSVEEKENGFVLRSTDANKPPLSFFCRASDTVKQDWMTTISKILQIQKDFLKALQSPIAYQRELSNAFT